MLGTQGRLFLFICPFFSHSDRGASENRASQKGKTASYDRRRPAINGQKQKALRLKL